MKKFFAVFLTILGILGLASCSSAKTSFKSKGKKVSENVFTEKLIDALYGLSDVFEIESDDDIEVKVYTKSSSNKTDKYDTGVKETSKSKEESNLVVKADSKNEAMSIKGDYSYTFELEGPDENRNETESEKIDQVIQSKGDAVAFVDKLTKTYSVYSSDIDSVVEQKLSGYMSQITGGFDTDSFDEDGDITCYVSGDEVFTVVYEYESSKETSKATIQLILDDDEIGFIAEYDTEYTENESWGVREVEQYSFSSVSMKIKDVSAKAVDLSGYDKN